jgi:hypothetical protein
MAAGAGFYDANGVWQYGETDAIALFSDTLNKGMDSVSDAITADRTRLTTLETATADTGWITLTISAGGWTVLQPVRYRKIGSVVYIDGELVGGTVGNTVIATLPAGFRPSKRITFLLLDWGTGTTDGRLQIADTGTLQIYGGNGGTASPGLTLGSVQFVVA